jgi:hypothetical protein
MNPALTSEEWRNQVTRTRGGALRIVVDFGPPANTVQLNDDPKMRHALAALALHGQSFGFTHADLNLLSEAAGRIEGEDSAQTPLADALMALAARIESLLPPEVK